MPRCQFSSSSFRKPLGTSFSLAPPSGSAGAPTVDVAVGAWPPTLCPSAAASSRQRQRPPTRKPQRPGQMLKSLKSYLSWFSAFLGFNKGVSSLLPTLCLSGTLRMDVLKGRRCCGVVAGSSSWQLVCQRAEKALYDTFLSRYSYTSTSDVSNTAAGLCRIPLRPPQCRDQDQYSHPAWLH